MPHSDSHERTLLVHIGTAYVRAALTTPQGRELNRFTKTPIGFGSSLVRSALLKHTASALKETLKGFETTKIDAVKVVVSSPWYHASIRSVHSTAKKETPITSDTVLRAVERYKDEVPPKAGRSDLEAVAVQVLVNGYPTNLKHLVHGTSLKVNLYESEIDTDVKDLFLTEVTRVAPHATVNLYSFPLAFSLGIREIAVPTSYIALDMGGEVTDVVLVDHDAFSFLGSIPIGYYSIARSIGGDAEGAVHDTLSRLALLERKELTDAEAEKLQEKQQKALTSWHKAFGDLLETAGAHAPIPRTVYVSSETTVSPWLTTSLKEKYATHHFESLSPAFVSDLVVPGKEGGTFDVPLSLIKVFFMLSTDDVFGASEAGVNEKAGIQLFKKKETFA